MGDDRHRRRDGCSRSPDCLPDRGRRRDRTPGGRSLAGRRSAVPRLELSSPGGTGSPFPVSPIRAPIPWPAGALAAGRRDRRLDADRCHRRGVDLPSSWHTVAVGPPGPVVAAVLRGAHRREHPGVSVRGIPGAHARLATGRPAVPARRARSRHQLAPRLGRRVPCGGQWRDQAFTGPAVALGCPSPPVRCAGALAS